MKTVITAIVFFFHSSLLFGQRLKIKSLTPISKVQYLKHQPNNKTVIERCKIVKTKGIIKFKTAKKTIRLKDDGEFIEYSCIGGIKGTVLKLVQKLELNSEEYYLIDTETAHIDTLVGEPIFSTNKKYIVCLQGAKTDVEQKIQVGEIENGKFYNKGSTKLRNDIYPNYVYWFDYYLCRRQPKTLLETYL